MCYLQSKSGLWRTISQTFASMHDVEREKKDMEIAKKHFDPLWILSLMHYSCQNGNHLVTCCLHSVSIQKSFEFNSLVCHKLTCDADYFAKSYICPGSLDIHTQVCENIFGNFSIVTVYAIHTHFPADI